MSEIPTTTRPRDAEGFTYAEWRGRKTRVALIVGAATYGYNPLTPYLAHQCGNPACIRPDHLKWMTGFEFAQAQTKGIVGSFADPTLDWK